MSRGDGVAGSISVQNLGKVFKQYSSQWQQVAELLLNRSFHEEFWALKGVSFQVPPGQAFGVVGNNGAGKSTLLKLLCGATLPTEGAVELQGVPAALLDLGAGFHPEFTGRENIYFNGAMLGFSKEEITDREEEIVSFSEMEEFIDQPVKTYSSGMVVRLGFAVATGFEPDLLIIDEVLAVGDQGFQKKCTDRILKYQEQGRTIVFCSHNLYHVRKMCSQALWLHRGEVKAIGDSDEVVLAYEESNIRPEEEDVGAEGVAQVDPGRKAICRVARTRLVDAAGNEREVFDSSEELHLQVWTVFSEAFEGEPGVAVSLYLNDGTRIYTSSTGIDGFALERVSAEEHYCTFVLKGGQLMAGRFNFNVMTTDHYNMQTYSVVEGVHPFRIKDERLDFGIVSLEHEWRS